MALTKAMKDLLESDHKMTDYKSWFYNGVKWVKGPGYQPPVTRSVKAKPKDDDIEDDVKYY